MVVDLVPRGRANRPGILLREGRPLFVTVHETGNNRAGMDAQQHRTFVHNGGGPQGVSFHYVVDDRTAYCLIPPVERAWHAGDGADGPGNATSLAVEHCVNEDADWRQMMLNGCRLVAGLCFVWGLPVERVVPHSHWRSTDCPAWLRGTGLWDEYVHRVRGLLAYLESGAP